VIAVGDSTSGASSRLTSLARQCVRNNEFRTAAAHHGYITGYKGGGVGKRLVTAMVTVSSSHSDPLSFPAVPFWPCRDRAAGNDVCLSQTDPLACRKATIGLGTGSPFVVGFSYRWQLTIPHSNT
jgi:hypothetical protein